MKKQFSTIITICILLFFSARDVRADAYSLSSSQSNFSHSCTVGSSDCLWQSQVTATNVSGSPLSNTKIRVESSSGIMTYVAPGGNETNGETTISQVIQPNEQAINTLLRVRPPTNKTGTYYSRFYVDGQICNNPSDCYYAGAGVITVVSEITASPTSQPTTLPTATTIPPTTNPLPTSVIPTSTATPQSSPTLSPTITVTPTTKTSSSTTTQSDTSDTSSENTDTGKKTEISVTPEPTSLSYPQKFFEILGIGGSDKSDVDKDQDNSKEATGDLSNIRENKENNLFTRIISGLLLIAFFLVFIVLLIGYTYPEKFPAGKKIVQKLNLLIAKLKRKLS